MDRPDHGAAAVKDLRYVRFVVATGTAFQSITLYGPFDTANDAAAWADARLGQTIPYEVVRVYK